MIISKRQDLHDTKSKFMNLSMNLLVFFTICFCSCQSQYESDKGNQINYKKDSLAVDIDTIYFYLAKNHKINYQEVSGQFIYSESNSIKDMHIANFISKQIESKVSYITYADDKKDIIIIGNKNLNLETKLDPISIKVYQLLFADKSYLVFLGKAQSASGSGTQLTYFILLELNGKKKVVNLNEFESRFGNINNIVDYDNDKTLDYFKIANGNKMGEYLLSVNNVQNKVQITKNQVLIRYQFNDKFTILKNSLN